MLLDLPSRRQPAPEVPSNRASLPQSSWQIHHMFAFVSAQAIVAELLETFKPACLTTECSSGSFRICKRSRICPAKGQVEREPQCADASELAASLRTDITRDDLTNQCGTQGDRNKELSARAEHECLSGAAGLA